ncbi:MAG TPA: hypothetical protein PLL30_03760 [Candidatus Krumholzibacteria bacterium]|nr:hypothetical protein [Candidatus Krumholzibacteria bacterium]HPD70890.1 hypothetical protein [Candidatus Krumholzibacteria bacterium]HRY39410.1 hypothetical protein [Candidatus Krumholzibacteria bacterium]
MADRSSEREIRPADLLAAYELGLLDPADCARFEAATTDDPDLLLDLYDSAADAQALARDPGRFAQVMRAALRPPRSGLVERIRQPFRRGPRRWVLAPVAAALALAVFLLVPGGDESLRSLAVLEPLPASRVEVRAGESQAEVAYGAALDLYRASRWRDATGAFQRSLDAADATWSRRDQARLYLGSSLLLAGRIEAAIPELAAAGASPLPPVHERAAWQLAQAYLLLDDLARARETLAGLRSSPVYGDRAAALLETLSARD